MSDRHPAPVCHLALDKVLPKNSIFCALHGQRLGVTMSPRCATCGVGIPYGQYQCGNCRLADELQRVRQAQAAQNFQAGVETAASSAATLMDRMGGVRKTLVVLLTIGLAVVAAVKNPWPNYLWMVPLALFFGWIIFAFAIAFLEEVVSLIAAVYGGRHFHDAQTAFWVGVATFAVCDIVLRLTTHFLGIATGRAGRRAKQTFAQKS